jgi:hypothetical protein
MESIMNLIPSRVSAEKNAKLCVPIELKELKKAMQAMASEKAPKPDGVMREFFKTYWDLVGPDDLSMVQLGLQTGMLPISVVRGLITLLHKEGNRLPLGNYRPIIPLNSTYKIYSKFLQRRFQSVLMEIINPDQSAFLPVKYILDNIVLTQKTLTWAKPSK